MAKHTLSPITEKGERRKAETVSRGLPRLAAEGWLPFFEEGEDIFGGERAGGFEFATLLAEKEFAVGVEDGNGGDAAVERNVVFLCDVKILVHMADVDVNHFEGFVHGGSNFGAVQGLVENVAIEAPVPAEDDEDAFVGCGGGVESVSDLLVGVG